MEADIHLRTLHTKDATKIRCNRVVSALVAEIYVAQYGNEESDIEVAENRNSIMEQVYKNQKYVPIWI
jgi:hypothetical protein